MAHHAGAEQFKSVSVWIDGPNVVALLESEVFTKDFATDEAARQASVRLAHGENPRITLGRTAKRLPLDRIQSVEWVPTVGMLLVKWAWWRDPWRVPFSNAKIGEEVFSTLGQRIHPEAIPVEVPVGANDLQMDPKVGLPALLTVIGLIALIGGAIEGPAQAAVFGPAARFAVLAEIGGEIGPWAAMGVGILALLIGVAALIYWYRNRPRKLVIRRIR